jgi:predicted enzyme related to lactoylglutathione lyase
MGKRTSYPPGTFSWVDLATTDVAAATSFYAGLFGWQTEHDRATGYTRCRIDGDDVCGLFEMSADRRATGIPPSWTNYVTVTDVEAAVARAEELGAGTVREPFDVLDLARIAALEDPQGAVFALWQPRTGIGAGRVNDVGCLCMNELATTDVDAARAFYEGLFGWTTETVDTGPDGPLVVSAHNRGTLNASFTQIEAASHWRPYFTVESTGTAVARVRELGGQVVLEPVRTGDGSIAVALDPQGAVFAVFAGEVDP